jgi:hypothetical protein
MKNLNPNLSKIDKLRVKANRKQIPLCRDCHMAKHYPQTYGNIDRKDILDEGTI